MRTRLPIVRIGGGEYLASDSEVVISTLLGSCVAVCLYDPFHKVAGMNHIMSTRKEYLVSEQVCYREDGKFGFCAMDLLIREMMQKGAVFKNMRAKIFGGASLFRPYNECTIEYCVGEENIRFVTNYLKINSIPVVSKSVGGEYGKVIWFFSDDYTVRVRKVEKRSTPVLIQKDNRAWETLKQGGKV